MMRVIWQFILKYEFWVLIAIWLGFFIAHEITEEAQFANIGFLIFIFATTRLAMHPMWKKGDQAREE